jgi:hypothetical protein
MTNMKKILAYYGLETIEEAAKEMGFSVVDAERALKEMYEDDTAPLAD